MNTVHKMQVYKSLYNKYASNLTKEEIDKGVSILSGMVDQQQAINAFFKKYTGKDAGVETRVKLSQLLDPDSVKGIIDEENKKIEQKNKEIQDKIDKQNKADKDKFNKRVEDTFNIAVEGKSFSGFTVEKKEEWLKKNGYVLTGDDDNLHYVKPEEISATEDVLDTAGNQVNAVKNFLGNVFGGQDIGESFVEAAARYYMDEAEDAQNYRIRENPNYFNDANKKINEEIDAAKKTLEKLELNPEENAGEIKNLNDQIAKLKKSRPSGLKMYEVKEVQDFRDAAEDLATEGLAFVEDVQGEDKISELEKKFLAENPGEDFTQFREYLERRALQNSFKDYISKISLLNKHKVDPKYGEEIENSIKKAVEQYGVDEEELRKQIYGTGKSAREQRTTLRAEYIDGLFEDDYKNLEKEYNKSLEDRGFRLDTWADDEYVKIIYPNANEEEVIEIIQGERMEVAPSEAAVAQMKQYLDLSELEQLTKEGSTFWKKGFDLYDIEEVEEGELSIIEGKKAALQRAKIQEKIDLAYSRAIGDDEVIKQKAKELQEFYKDELSNYRDELIADHDMSDPDDVMKVNEMYNAKYNELVLSNLVASDEYKERATAIGFAFAEIGRKYDVDFTRQQSWFTRTMDSLYDRDDFDWYNPIEWAAVTLNGIGSGVEGMTTSIADQSVASFQGFMARDRESKIKTLDNLLKTKEVDENTKISFDVFGQIVMDDENGLTIAEQKEILSDKKNYWDRAITRQMEEALTSQKRLEAYGSANYDDGIGLEDIFATLGNTIPHIALATAGTMIAGPGVGFGSVLTGEAGFLAATAAYTGTVAMGLQMYGDNYNSAIEQNLINKGLGREAIRKRITEENPELNIAEINTLVEEEYSNNLVENYSSGEGANMAKSAAIAAMQTALESYGAQQIVGSLQNTLKGAGTVGSKLNITNLAHATWDDIGSNLYRWAINRGGSALEEFGTEYMQEVLGMMSTGMQTGEGAGKYVNFDEALQAGIGGGISGFFLPFAGDIKTQGAMAIRETAANIALRYGGDNKYLTKVKTAIEWFNQSKAELDRDLENKSISQEDYYEKVRALSNVKNAALKLNLLGNKAGIGNNFMTKEDRTSLMDLYIDMGMLDQEIELAKDNEPLQNALKAERKVLTDAATEIIIKNRNAINAAKAESLAERRKTTGMGVNPLANAFRNKRSGREEEMDLTEKSAEELVAEFELDKSQNDDYTKLERLRIKGVDSNTQAGFDQIIEAGAGIIENAFKRLYQKGSMATPKQFRQELQNEFIKVYDSYTTDKDKNNLGIGKQTSNLFNLRANKVATRNIRQQGNTISMSDEKAPQIKDTTEQTDFDAEQLQEVGKREKKYMANNTKVTEAVGEEAASEIDRETSQEILREANKGESAEGIAGALARAFGQATNRGGRGLFNIIGKKVGTLNKGFKDFVDNTVDRDFIAALPAAFLKQSKPLQKILGIKNIGDTQVVKTDKDGKKTYSRPSVFAIPSDITDEQVQQVRDYFKSTPTSREGLLKRLSQEFALNSINKLKQNKDFMQKLQTALGDKQNALDFLNEIESKLDQRTLEDTTKDITVPSKTMKQIIKLLDKGIKLFEAKPGEMRMEIIPGGGNAVAFILKGIKAGLQQGLSFVQALKKVVKQIKDYNAVTKEQKQIIDDQIGSLTEADLDNYEKVQQIVDTALAEVALNKYKNVAESEIEDIKKILKGKNKTNKVKALKNFFQFVNTSFQKNSKAHKLWEGDNAEVAFNYWQKEFGVDLGKLGFTLSDGKNKSILLEGEKVVDAGPLRPSNAPTNIQKAYTKKGFKGALEYIRNNIAKADQNSDDAINFIVDTIGDLIEAGKVDVAVQLLDTMGYASDSALRMVGKIRSIQDNVKTVDGKKSVEFEHTPPISVLRDKIRGVLKSNLNVESVKQQIRDILNESYVDIIGKQEAKKLNDTKEKGGLGRKTTGETKARYDGVINQKNLIDIERGPENLVKEKKEASDKNADLAPDIVNKKDNTKKVKKTFLQSLKARIKALKINKKPKGLSAFDMDDTLALTKEKVLYTMPDGKKGELTAGEFAVQYEGLLEQGAEFDYSNFDNVDLSTEKGPLAGTALKRQGKYGSKDIYIVTASKLWADSIGLNIPLENIITLEDGSPQAKADWLLSKAEQGYNDFYFADDSALNVQTVKDILSQIDVKSRVQLAVSDKANRLDQEMNDLIEDATDIGSGDIVSDVEASIEGKKRDKGFFKRVLRQFKITASADDFLGLGYYLFGKGDKGTRQQKWFIKNLIEPYNKAEQQLISAKIAVANDFAALKKNFPSLTTKGLKSLISNPLNQEIGYKSYTKSQATRVYLWNKQGMDIPGMSEADINGLVAAVEADQELSIFADNLQLIQKTEQYPKPGANWLAGDIKSDILSSLDSTFRSELLTEWKENVDIVFSDKNMNKLEKAFGSKYVEALRDSLKRMESGTNRPTYTGSGSRQVNEMMDWLNGSVGVAMFLNMRSGSLQMLSNVNFINWGDNNIYAAAKAFVSKDYVPTVIKLMNSDYLVNRRDGLKINVNEAELAAAANKGGFKGMLNYILDKGFVLTRIFDTLAIATGGATFYMNRVKSLQNRVNPETGKNYTLQEAEVKAFDDFYAIAEETQQSSNPSKISSQQASLFGRLILSYQNVTMQYNRKTKKSLLDLINRRRKPGMTQRESDLSNLSSVVYYVAVQNLIFNSLQQALFALAFDEEDEKEKDKVANTINGMIDSLLFGLGFGGAIISTFKNVSLKLLDESEKKSPKYEEAAWNLFDISPVLDAKVRNIRTAFKTFSWNRKEMNKRGWSLENPAYLAIAQIISAATNLPIDRALRKYNNVSQAFDEETRTYERIALLMGWNGWNFGLPYWGRESTIKREAEEEEKLKEKFKNDVRKFKNMGFTKRVPFTGPNSGKPKGELGVDYVAIERYDGVIQYYIKPKK